MAIFYSCIYIASKKFSLNCHCVYLLNTFTFTVVCGRGAGVWWHMLLSYLRSGSVFLLAGNPIGPSANEVECVDDVLGCIVLG